MAKTFVLSDGTLNSKGFRILTSGIQLDQFIKNPIMLFMHNRPWRGSKDEYTVIGRWENIRVEGDQLLADAVFDLNDPFAKQIADKVENNFLRMASIGILPVESSDDPSLIVQGQRYETVTKSIAKEASIVDIGSNDNALTLSDVPALYNMQDALIELSADDKAPLIPLLTLNNTDMLVKLTDAAAILELAEGATEAQVIEAIKKQKTERDTAVQELADLKKVQREKEINDMVTLAAEQKKITAAQVEDFKTLAAADFTTAKKILDGMKAYEPIQAQLADATNTANADTTDLMKLSGEELWQSGKLQTLKDKNFEGFKLKYKEAFGTDYTDK